MLRRVAPWLVGLLAVARLPAASIPGLYATGVDNSGALLAAGAVDSHYRLIQSADASRPGPAAYVVDNNWPIAPAGPWLAHGPASKWIAPQTSQATGNQPGDYIFRLTFDLTGLDPDSAVITGRWSTDNAGVGIRINGVDTGISYDGNFGAFSGYWTLSSGFVEGTNTLDFTVNNAGTAVSPIGLRVEVSGTADLPPPAGTPPSITAQPQSVTVFLQDPASFSVKAYGSRPFFYQWRYNRQPIPGATNATHSIAAVSPTDVGSYDVIVSNDAGSATSQAATVSAVFAPPGQALREPLGPSNRRSGLAFSELMYHPRDRDDGRNLEFIEIYNSNPWQEDLSGWSLGGDVHWTFPNGTIIAGLGFLVIAPVPADVEAIYGITGVLGGFTNNFPNPGGSIRLVKRSGAIVIDVTYSDQPPWPVSADGAGHSLVLARPSFGDRNPAAWAASAFFGGSPGAADPLPAAPQDSVVINEVLAHTDPPLLDFVELYNYSPLTVDLSGCWLTDERNTNKFRIPDGTVLNAQGYVAFDENALGFALSAGGETVYLVSSNATRVIDAVRFGGLSQGVSYGRYPDGAPTLSVLAARSEGTTNAPVMVPSVVINEILFHPVSRDSDDEYVELHSRAGGDVDVSGWRLSGGISFTLPTPTLLPAGGYLVIARNAARLMSNYPGLTSANCLGNYSGSLANGGERIALEAPDASVTTNATGQFVTNSFRVVVNEVTYFDRSRWSRFADGGGSSLELVDAHADNRHPARWLDSDETAKAPWTPVQFTGTVDNAMPSVSADQVQLFLLGEGEALVDDVEVVVSGANRVPNANFESGTTGWILQGTQVRSSWETNGGYNSARSLHLRASDRGEPIINRVRAPLSSTVASGATVTLRAKVRWLAGAPEFLMRLHGGGIEATARLNVPANLGTPGARNSRARDNAGPLIADTTHRPVLPSAGQPIRVFARVTDPDGVGSVALKYRVDPATSLTTVAMRDDGTEGDLLAGDGVFTAVIPGQPKDTLIAFRVEATDAASASATSQFPAEAPVRECHVRVGDQFIAGPFGNYRIWMTQATLNTWASRGNLNNDPLDVTFIYGNSRIVYSAGSLYAGSPAWSPGYNSPIGNLCAYDVLFPGDDQALNDDKFSLDVPIRDPTNQREQLMHWIADQYDLPNLYRRDVYLFVNGVRRGAQGGVIYHDTQQPDGDMLDEWFHDDPDGTLVKAAQWSEGDDVGGVQSILLPSIERLLSGGALKIAAYRWPWRLRAADSQLDYTNFLSMVEAANAPTNTYQSQVEGLINIEDWMRMFAMNDLCSYWDAVGNPNRKNTYLYKPHRGNWRTIPWDFDVGLGVFNDPVDAALFPAAGPGGVDPTIHRMYNFPAFVRAYWRELEFGMKTIFPNPAVTTILASKYDGYRTNGLSFTSPFDPSGPYSLSVPAWINARSNYLRGQLATVASPFSVTTPAQFTTNRNVALISGRAPVAVKTITINGIAYPVTWATTTSWTLRVPLDSGTNVLEVAALDRSGADLSNATARVTVNYIGEQELPELSVVINELMHHPPVPGTAYLELFNRSRTHSFDLSQWRLNGLDYTFPNGTLLAPQSYLVLVENRAAFTAAFGASIPVFDEFNGRLDPDGETLTLFRPGTQPGAEFVVDRVRYEADPPWPAGARQSTSAIQVIDAAQDNSRVSNWSDGSRWREGWRYFSFTGTNASSVGTRLAFYFESTGGDVYLDDIFLVPGVVAATGTNLITNGDFESGSLTPWIASGIASTSAVVTGTAHSGSNCLRLVFGQGGVSINNFYQLLSPTMAANTAHTVSFWYLPANKGTNLTAYVNSFFRPMATVRVTPALLTPGAANAIQESLPPYPLLWLNEVQPENLSGLTNGTGARAPWIELFNADTNSVSLDGWFLADNYTNLSQWAFPSGTVILPGQFLTVWADARPELTAPDELHTSFRLAPGEGSVALSRQIEGGLQLADYFNYRQVPPNQSYGAVPDGQPFFRKVLFYPTPGATNNPASPPVTIYINEWMAGNTGALLDPADQDADDWFELYNPNAAPVDLGGLYLTDALADRFQFRIPTNGQYAIGPHGFLLVWADSEPGQNSTERADLHVNFKLAQSSEAIGLFAPDGTTIDAVTFGVQTDNVSEGRFPDGVGPRYFMTTPTPRAANRIAEPPAPPQLDGVGMTAGGMLQFTFTVPAGQRYQVEYQLDLNASAWIPLGAPQTASGTPVVITDGPVTQGQRFYRLVLFP